MSGLHGHDDGAATVQWLTELAHDDAPTLVGTVVPQQPPVTEEITTAARWTCEHVAERESDAWQRHKLDGYLKARVPGRVNPVGGLKHNQEINSEVKAAARLLKIGREERVARLNGGA